MSWSDKHAIYYTAFSEFEQCPKKFFHRNIARDYPFHENESLVWGRAVHKAIEMRLKPGRKPLPENMAQFEGFCQVILEYPIVIPEKTFGMTWESEARDPKAAGCAIGAKGDITIMTADGKTATCIDIKTGKPKEDPFQLYLQALTLMAHYPTLQTVKGAYYWTQDARLGAVYDLTDCWDRAMPRLMDMADKVDELMGPPVNVKGFVAVPGDPFPCKWCNAPCEFAGGE